MTFLIPLIIFLFILTFIVFIHELGHFYFAKKFKVKVEEFGLGIPPRAIGRMYKGTLYSLNWLPFGGFVRMKGEDYNDYSPKDNENFVNKKPWQKSIILLAGVCMNLLLAVVIFYFTLGINGFKSAPLLLIGNYDFKYSKVVRLPNVITFVQKDGPAEKAGIQFGDRIVRVEYQGEIIEPQTNDELRNFYKDKDGRELKIYTTNINTQAENVYILTPMFLEKINQAGIGVGLNNGIVLDYSTSFYKPLAGFLHSLNLTGYSLNVMGGMIKTSVEKKDVSYVADGVSGPVGVFGAVSSIVTHGGSNTLMALLDLAALLSLSLGIMNLLPIPALDGGRFVFVLYEWISGKKLNQTLEAKLVQYGFIGLLALIAIITLKDIFALF